MAQARKGKLNYRCPNCFRRDIDMDMFYDEAKKEYYCIRCCFHGTEAQVKAMNEVTKEKYGRRYDRVVDFGADNGEIKYKKHKKGTL
ncbi:MAG: hypothetical protein BWY98_00078 [Tenericutes bacterium ADurb.BinA155]|jgi:Zn ribbon nucleic-acid-binding protein|nr:MAG: hypothetical protein BWY98_00078 [Tenericutes bacterium ADurb.BinA155]